ncbi:MAG TPA: lysylphosphatidylglycerol synthase transmembrane domain-containing protein [Gaiellaceae bacterium]|nr:lysylphosphatidylglycerol synthase transmembrane domain-containing protein [Gaiellaceae bacterium]
MSSVDVSVAEAEAPAGKRSRVLPFNDPSRRRRLVKVAAWLGGVALLLVVLNLLGVDVQGWLSDVWDALTEISVGYLLAGWALQTVQTTLTALAWYFILRAGFPRAPAPYLQVLAAYSAGVALNGFLPANIGTFVMLLMFVAMIPGANFPGVLGGMVVQKIFFTVVGTLVYLYLFLSVPGSYNLQLGIPHDHPALTLLVLAGAAFLLVLLGRIFWRKLQGLWVKAKRGGAILARPRDYFVQVFLPSLGAWLAKLGVTAVFLAGYGIPVTFHSIMSVIGGNSLANTVSATPGGVGINQAVNAIALDDVTSTANATAYSLGQQLAVTTWNIAFAVVLVVWAFGWTGGKLLVRQSYDDAKVKVAEQKEQRAEQRAAKKAAKGVPTDD